MNCGIPLSCYGCTELIAPIHGIPGDYIAYRDYSESTYTQICSLLRGTIAFILHAFNRTSICRLAQQKRDILALRTTCVGLSRDFSESRMLSGYNILEIESHGEHCAGPPHFLEYKGRGVCIPGITYFGTFILATTPPPGALANSLRLRCSIPLGVIYLASRAVSISNLRRISVVMSTFSNPSGKAGCAFLLSTYMARISVFLRHRYFRAARLDLA
ncbi:hypothetical protein B0H21DRAFT_85304 [Amylocystis lapponica]|nr:hypothetical protein B0H21DRAFT_85304 [Amylocystis lapponica]